MISENGPAFPLPLHLPPGHMVQQVLDENGVLTHVIMSQPGPPPPPPPLPHHHMVKQKTFNSKCHSFFFLSLSFQHTGYSAPPFNGIYGHPHQYHNPNVYGPYPADTLSFPPRSTSNHPSSPSSTNRMKISVK
jgi:hypothetical protein